MYDGADLPSYGAPTGGGRFAQAAAIAQMVQPPSPPRGVPRNKELMPGSEQSYHMEASTSYMDGLADGHSTATGGLLHTALALEFGFSCQIRWEH